MFQKLRLIVLAILVATGFGSFASTALAQTVYSSTPSSVSVDNGPGSTYVDTFTVSTATPITAIAQRTLAGATSNQRFFISNATTGAVLYLSPVKTFAPDAGAPTFKRSDDFAAFILQPGTPYVIGMIADVSQAAYYNSNPAPAAQNGITNTGFRIALNRDAPVLAGGSSSLYFDMQLFGVLPTPVPTMSEWAMILFGTVLAGGAALYIQRRRFSA